MSPSTHPASTTSRQDELAARSSRVPGLDDAVRRACARVMPTWPLDRFIAVNPFWGMIESPLPEVAARMKSHAGAELLMPRAWYREAYREGRIRDRHLRAALEQRGSSEGLDGVRDALERSEPVLPTRARVVDVVDADRDPIHEQSWRSYVTHSVSQFCAAHFDDGQAQLGPSREGGLYASWLRLAREDRGPAAAMGASSYRRHASDLPTSARDLIESAIGALDVPPAEHESYLWSLLLDQNGWASWCAYRRWTARLDGREDEAITDLLAIRLSWEWMLLRMGGPLVAQRWRAAMAIWPQVDAAAAAARIDDWLLQTALEIAWREPLLRALPEGLSASRPARASVQAVFCIDVRSEVFRRAVETSSSSIQTLGFAGFFGIPMDYQPLGAPAASPHLPGLLAPRVRASDTGSEGAASDRRARHLDLAAAWRSFKVDPLSTFTFVEALGLTFAAKLVGEAMGRGAVRAVHGAGLTPDMEEKRKPRLVASVSGEPLDAESRSDLAAAMLRGMSLTRDFARLVLFVGHGSTTRNNPHASGLDCGACCGQSGGVNARVAAALLNEPDVRAGLARREIFVPGATWFLAACHDTTTDDVELLDADELPTSHRRDEVALRAWLADASARARRERAGRLGVSPDDSRGLRATLHARARDWAQVRAEWGLADNAAFIIGPREHLRHLDLQGRAFLHEYRQQEDADGSILESIVTAPMVVAHWINLQYYASTVDNVRYGSGNKVLHNVVGGHLGVFEGNGGDLRIGLPLQSLHDGAKWVHTPQRLDVFIEAAEPAIDRILAKHRNVRALVENEWIALFRIDEETRSIFAWRSGRWVGIPPGGD